MHELCVCVCNTECIVAMLPHRNAYRWRGGTTTFMCLTLACGGNVWSVKVRVTLRLAVYHQSVRLGGYILEAHDQRFFFSTEPLRSQSLCNILSVEKMALPLWSVARPKNFYPRGETPQYPSDMGLGGARRRSGRCGQKNPCLCWVSIIIAFHFVSCLCIDNPDQGPQLTVSTVHWTTDRPTCPLDNPNEWRHREAR
jgi:hypothetical protein